MMKRLILLATGALSCAAFGEEAPAINATANLDRHSKQSRVSRLPMHGAETLSESFLQTTKKKNSPNGYSPKNMARTAALRESALACGE